MGVVAAGDGPGQPTVDTARRHDRRRKGTSRDIFIRFHSEAGKAIAVLYSRRSVKLNS
jgi:hypothetical protein